MDWPQNVQAVSLPLSLFFSFFDWYHFFGIAVSRKGDQGISKNLKLYHGLSILPPIMKVGNEFPKKDLFLLQVRVIFR